jgi:hypothetical protein
MALKDYKTLDPKDFYGQKFEKKGVASIWIGLMSKKEAGKLKGADVLQDLCGVGYYDSDSNENNCYDFKPVAVKKLLQEFSHSQSFLDAALKAAADKGIAKATYAAIQYDFAYNPKKVKRKVAADPAYLGVFPYRVDD